MEEKQDLIMKELVALRAQGDQTAKWLTTVSEQVSVVKEQVGETRQAQVKVREQANGTGDVYSRYFRAKYVTSMLPTHPAEL